MRGSQHRILTSHVGSLPRSDEPIAANRDRESAAPPADAEYQQTLRNAVPDVVRQQRDLGVKVPNDGEFGKPVTHRVRSRRPPPPADLLGKLGALAEGAALASRRLWG